MNLQAKIRQNPESDLPPMAHAIREFISYCRIECGFAEATLRAYAADLPAVKDAVVLDPVDEVRRALRVREHQVPILRAREHTRAAVRAHGASLPILQRHEVRQPSIDPC